MIITKFKLFENNNSSIKDDKYYRKCIENACKSKGETERYGAIVVKNGKILGEGYNRAISHATFKLERIIKQGYANHAEIEAMNDALAKGEDITDSDIYVAGYFPKDGTLFFKKEFTCKLCIPYFEKYGIRNIYVPLPEKWNKRSIEECKKDSLLFNRGSMHDDRLKHAIGTHKLSIMESVDTKKQNYELLMLYFKKHTIITEYQEWDLNILKTELRWTKGQNKIYLTPYTDSEGDITIYDEKLYRQVTCHGQENFDLYQKEPELPTTDEERKVYFDKYFSEIVPKTFEFIEKYYFLREMIMMMKKHQNNDIGLSFYTYDGKKEIIKGFRFNNNNNLILETNFRQSLQMFELSPKQLDELYNSGIESEYHTRTIAKKHGFLGEMKYLLKYDVLNEIADTTVEPNILHTIFSEDRKWEFIIKIKERYYLVYIQLYGSKTNTALKIDFTVQLPREKGKLYISPIDGTYGGLKTNDKDALLVMSNVIGTIRHWATEVAFNNTDLAKTIIKRIWINAMSEELGDKRRANLYDYFVKNILRKVGVKILGERDITQWYDDNFETSDNIHITTEYKIEPTTVERFGSAMGRDRLEMGEE